MKKGILFIVILFFAKPVFPILDFIINYDAIQEICENRSRPELKCNGNCYLKKELAKSAEQDNPYANNKKQHNLQFETLFIYDLDWKLDLMVPNALKQKTVSLASHYSFLGSADLFKPPLS